MSNKFIQSWRESWNTLSISLGDVVLKTRKSKITAILTLASLPIMLSFQNCSQQGGVSVSGSGSQSSASFAIDTSNVSANVDTSINQNSPAADISDDVSVEPVEASLKCHDIVVSDVKLSVKAVSSGSLGSSSAAADLVVDQAASVLSISQNSIKIKALKSVSLKEVFVQLNSVGNQVLSEKNEVMDLKAPSASQSGIKVQLDQAVSLKEGDSYILNVDIKAEDQIVSNASKCIFKPVIHQARIYSSK